MYTFLQRIFRSARLDPDLYKEVEADEKALNQATLVVILSSIAAGVGCTQQFGNVGLLVGTLTALGSWYLWAWVVYLVGTRLVPENLYSPNYEELLRIVGFASSPGLLRVLGIIPGWYGAVFLISGVWMLIAMVLAVHQALAYRSTLRAVGVCTFGWVVQLLLIGIVVALNGGLLFLLPGTVPA